jgi:hypothetical protein
MRLAISTGSVKESPPQQMFFNSTNLNGQKRLEIEESSDAVGLENHTLQWVPIKKQHPMRDDFMSEIQRRLVEDDDIERILPTKETEKVVHSISNPRKELSSILQ